MRPLQILTLLITNNNREDINKYEPQEMSDVIRHILDLVLIEVETIDTIPNLYYQYEKVLNNIYTYYIGEEIRTLAFECAYDLDMHIYEYEHNKTIDATIEVLIKLDNLTEGNVPKLLQYKEGLENKSFAPIALLEISQILTNIMESFDYKNVHWDLLISRLKEYKDYIDKSYR